MTDLPGFVLDFQRSRELEVGHGFDLWLMLGGPDTN